MIRHARFQCIEKGATSYWVKDYRQQKLIDTPIFPILDMITRGFERSGRSGRASKSRVNIGVQISYVKEGKFVSTHSLNMRAFALEKLFDEPDLFAPFRDLKMLDHRKFTHSKQ